MMIVSLNAELEILGSMFNFVLTLSVNKKVLVLIGFQRLTSGLILDCFLTRVLLKQTRY